MGLNPKKVLVKTLVGYKTHVFNRLATRWQMARWTEVY